MFRIKTLNKISPVGLAVLDKSQYTVSEDFEDPDGIIVRSADMHNYEFGASLRCIGRAGAGVNNIPLERCSENGIVVFNSPGANSGAVKELALCALLLASRDIIGGIDWVKSIADQGDEVANLVEKGKSKFTGPEIAGKTLGILGLGAVGRKIANAAIDLGMNVYGYDPYLSVDAAWMLSSRITHAVDLETIYRNCDYISIHVPLTNDTRGMINADAINLMKGHVRIINIARGELVNDAEMAEALASGKVARYVTDFPNGNTVKMAGCVAIPHLGASTPESEDNCAVMAADQVSRYLLQGDIVNSVNLPNITMERSGKYRAVVIAQADAAVKLEGKAVAEKTRGAYKVILADADSPFDEAALSAKPGVIRVRTL